MPKLPLIAALPLALAAPALPLLTGCGDVTAEKIEQWKGTEKGPSKLREAVRSGSVAPALRGHAVAALVELGMAGDVESDLKSAPEAERQATVHAALPELVDAAEGKCGRPGKAGPGEPMKHCERDAKDALFGLRGVAGAADRAAIDQELVAWTTVDLTGRMSAGGHSSDQILAAIGGPAGARLAAVIADPAQTEANRTEAARQLGRISASAASVDPAVRAQAAAALVARARREKPLREGTLEDLGLVGGPQAVAFLGAVATDGGQSEETRTKAVRALALNPDPSTAALAVRLAGDKRAGADVREAAFQLAEKLGTAAVPGLLRLMVTDASEIVRWRSVEAALDAGKAAAVSSVLAALQPGRAYKRADVKDYLVSDIVKLGASALPSLREALAAPSAIARAAAVMALAELGTAEDAPRLDALARDGARLPGFPGGATVGSEARTAATAIRARAR